MTTATVPAEALQTRKPANAREEGVDLIKLTAPLAVGAFAEMAIGFTDTMMVGRLGSVELAGVGIVVNFFFTLLLVGMGAVSIVAVIAAEAHARHERSGVSAALNNGVWFAIFLGVPLTVLFWFVPDALDLLGQPVDAIAVSREYVLTLTWSLLPYLLFTVARCFVSSLSRPRSVMVIAIAAVPLNAVINYGLIFGNFGLPRLEATGAGLGTTITNCVMLLAIVIEILRDRAFRPYRPFHGLFRIDRVLLLRMVRLGIPVGGLSGVESMFFTAIAVMMGWIGTIALAANQIAGTVSAMMFMIPWAMSQAVSVRVSYGVGWRDQVAARRAGFVAIRIGMVYMAAMAVVIWLFPETFISLFVDADDPQRAVVESLGLQLLLIAAVFQVVDGTQIIAMGALRGLQDTQIPFLIGTVGYWLTGLGSGYLFAFVFDWGATGLWWGVAMGLAAAAVLLTWRFHTRSKRPIPASS
ncbi:MAG: MATE family efflux transporter [Rhodospirillaceae bacterium]|nr:MATE family efflux transporter [Rhodospirillaceae bacterium]